jgi:Tfp pilus assembly protein FimV
MKIHFLKKVQWWALVFAVAMVFTGCAHRAQKPETKPPESRELAPAPAPAKPGTVPPEPTPPPRQPERAPAPAPTATPTAPSAEPAHKETYYTHTVKWSGETLFIIAAWYTGDRDHWREIAEAMFRVNPNVNIHVIRVGDKIPVPVSLLKTQSPMPKEFVDNFFQKPKTEKAPPKPAPSQTEEEEPKLFGPKELRKK